MKETRLIVISGPSGAGKSTAIKALEDMGFFCVDNVPVALLPKFMELIDQSQEIAKVAAVVDVRERGFLKDFTPVFNQLKQVGYRAELVYLDASDEALVRRFSETRRKHPIEGTETPLDGITRERVLLKDIRSHADRVIDTSEMNVHQLRDVMREHCASPATQERLSVNIVSFGYRFGVPSDADIVMDIRFLPNPYFVDSLKWLDGRDASVKEFVMSRPETQEFLERFKTLLGYLLPLYWKEGKSYLTIAVGCTGGKHRSVVVAEALAGAFDGLPVAIRKRDRDIGKP